MEEISPALTHYDIVEPASLAALGNKVQILDANKDAKTNKTPLRRVIENFYFTDAISRRFVPLPKYPFPTWCIVGVVVLTKVRI